jgi:20S proteasome subunit beta 7
MDHFPTNWGRPVSPNFPRNVAASHKNSAQRNDAVDAYGTYPIAQRPHNSPKDAFSTGVQRTQYVMLQPVMVYLT